MAWNISIISFQLGKNYELSPLKPHFTENSCPLNTGATSGIKVLVPLIKTYNRLFYEGNLNSAISVQYIFNPSFLQVVGGVLPEQDNACIYDIGAKQYTAQDFL